MTNYELNSELTIENKSKHFLKDQQIIKTGKLSKNRSAPTISNSLEIVIGTIILKSIII